MPIIAHNIAKMKQMVFKDLLLNPKYAIIYFRAQTKGWLASSEPHGKSAYVMLDHLTLYIINLDIKVFFL